MAKTIFKEWLNRHGSPHYHAGKRARHGGSDPETGKELKVPMTDRVIN